MTTEYIEKQAAMDKFAEFVAPSNNSDFARVPTWNDAVGIVEGFPPADVRPVVLCRDCKEYYFADNRVPEEQAWVCSWFGRVMRPDDFCCLGERKGGDAE